MDKQPYSIFWFRRDLRLTDNAGLYHALKSGLKVLPIFIFDQNILDKLEDKDDARVTFIHQQLRELNTQLQEFGSSILVKYGTPEQVWGTIFNEFEVESVYTNHDYEPYAKDRDKKSNILFTQRNIQLR